MLVMRKEEGILERLTHAAKDFFNLVRDVIKVTGVLSDARNHGVDVVGMSMITDEEGNNTLNLSVSNEKYERKSAALEYFNKNVWSAISGSESMESSWGDGFEYEYDYTGGEDDGYYLIDLDHIYNFVGVGDSRTFNEEQNTLNIVL